MQFVPLCQGRISKSVYTVWDRNLSSPAALACCWPLVSAGSTSLLVTCFPAKGHGPSQHLPLPAWRNPPSSWDLLFSARAHTAPGLHTLYFMNSCSDLLLKTFSSEDLTSSKCSLGWCSICRWFLLTPFLSTRQNSSPWPAPHRRKELHLQPLSPNYSALPFPGHGSLNLLCALLWTPLTITASLKCCTLRELFQLIHHKLMDFCSPHHSYCSLLFITHYLAYSAELWAASWLLACSQSSPSLDF